MTSYDQLATAQQNSTSGLFYLARGQEALFRQMSEQYSSKLISAARPALHGSSCHRLYSPGTAPRKMCVVERSSEESGSPAKVQKGSQRMQGTTSLVEEGEVCLLSVPRPGVSPATRYKVNVTQCSSVLTGKLNLRWGGGRWVQGDNITNHQTKSLHN